MQNSQLLVPSLEKIDRLLQSSHEQDVLLAFSLLKYYTFEDLMNLSNILVVTNGYIEIKSFVGVDRPTIYYKINSTLYVIIYRGEFRFRIPHTNGFAAHYEIIDL